MGFFDFRKTTYDVFQSIPKYSMSANSTPGVLNGRALARSDKLYIPASSGAQCIVFDKNFSGSFSGSWTTGTPNNIADNTNNIFVCTTSGLKISGDNGATWSSSTTFASTNCGPLSASDSLVLASLGSGMHYSTDNGDTFLSVPGLDPYTSSTFSAPGIGSYSGYLKYFPETKKHVMVGQRNTVGTPDGVLYAFDDQNTFSSIDITNAGQLTAVTYFDGYYYAFSSITGDSRSGVCYKIDKNLTGYTELQSASVSYGTSYQMQIFDAIVHNGTVYAVMGNTFPAIFKLQAGVFTLVPCGGTFPTSDTNKNRFAVEFNGNMYTNLGGVLISNLRSQTT